MLVVITLEVFIVQIIMIHTVKLLMNVRIIVIKEEYV